MSTTQIMISLLLAILSGGIVTVLGSSGVDSSVLSNETIRCVNPQGFAPFGVVVPIIKPHKNRKLPMDTAVVTVNSLLQTSLCAQSDECWKCAFVNVSAGYPTKSANQTLWVDTRFAVTFHFYHTKGDNSSVFCSIHEKLEQYGQYMISIYRGPDRGRGLGYGIKCNISAESVPGDSNIPVYIAMGALAGLSIIWMILKFMYRKRLFEGIRLVPAVDTERLINSDLGTPNPAGPDSPDEATAPLIESPPKQPRQRRLQSLDAFRGFCLIVMVFVNYRGGYYWYFHHSAWNGLTVADLVFPWFVFIMGTSVALAFRGQLVKGVPRRLLLWKVTKRTVILFWLGLVLTNSGSGGAEVDPKDVRIPGVLQRLAATYFVVGLMEVVFARVDDRYEDRWWRSVRDIVIFWPEWIISLSLVTVQLCLTFLMPVNGCPTGYQGPGGLHDYTKHQNCTGGAAGAIDRWFFKPAHMYGHPTCMKMYLDTTAHDPEGILGTLTSVFMCFLGLQAGKILLTYKGSWQRISRWICWAIVTGAIGACLCKFGQNDGWIPVNKNLWSLSFVLVLASMAFFLLTVFYLLIDVFHLWGGAPFLYPGMNSILIYSCHEIFANYFPVQFHVEKTHAAQLAMSMWGAALWVIVSVVLYYKKVFVAI